MKTLENIIQPFRLFGNWWLSEMVAMIPDKLKNTLISRNYCNIHLSEGKTVIEAVISGQGSLLEENQSIFDLDQECWNDIYGIADNISPRLFLAAHDIFITDIKLPAKANVDLKSAISHQLSLYSPLNINQIEWNYCQIDSTNKKQIACKLAIVKTSKLNEIEMLFAEHDIMPPTIAINIDGKILYYRKPLIMKRSISSDRGLQLKLVSLLLLLSIPLSSLIAADIIISNNIKESAIIENQIIPKIALWRDAQDQEKVRKQLRPLSNRRVIMPFLEELAVILPEDSWIESAQLQKKSDIVIQINTPSSSDLTEILKEAKLFEITNIANSEEIELERKVTNIGVKIK